MEQKLTNKKYFAAANGYAGFRSYFSEAFSVREHERIYVLKGGPGTGKSSFMRRLSSDLSVKGCTVEEIYCSSDPKSLDGIIVYGNGKSIAVIDGTAPHETDATVPGACDELVNLGDAWDSRWLSGERERILKINDEKKNAYKCAYSCLSIAGKAHDAKSEFKAELYDAEKAKSAIKSLADSASSANIGKSSTRLISAFGKRGLVRFDTIEAASEKIFSVSGDEYASERFLTDLCNTLKQREIELIRCPSPLDPKVIEGIFIPSIKSCFVIGERENTISCDAFFTDNALSLERRKCAEECHRIALDDAERWFAIASELHFALEDIYTRAMDFDVINRLYEKKLGEIEGILA